MDTAGSGTVDDDGLPVERPDVVQIRFRAEADGTVTKVIHAAGIEEPFVDPYPYNRQELLSALQRSVIPASYDPVYQADVGNAMTGALVSFDPSGSPLGRELFEAGAAAGKGQPVTLQLAFDEGAVPATQLPWEIMHDADGPVLATERLRLNRHITYFGDREPFEEVDPMRVLYLEARPKDAGFVPDLTGAYADAVDSVGGLETKLIRRATFADLESALASEEFHVVHFDGHGAFDGMAGYLLFEDGSRQTDWVPAERLAGVLGGSDVRLVVLGACQGSTVGSHGLFQSTAPGLIRAGVPAVVANQFEVLSTAQERFTFAFYQSLTRRESISGAVADGRKAIADVSGHYFLPTLYLRVADGEGYLFGGEPATHRRWRRTELRRLAAWWWGMTEIQRTLYLEGILRWRGQVVEPVELPRTRRVVAEPSPEIQPTEGVGADSPPSASPTRRVGTDPPQDVTQTSAGSEKHVYRSDHAFVMAKATMYDQAPSSLCRFCKVHQDPAGSDFLNTVEYPACLGRRCEVCGLSHAAMTGDRMAGTLEPLHLTRDVPTGVRFLGEPAGGSVVEPRALEAHPFRSPHSWAQWVPLWERCEYCHQERPEGQPTPPYVPASCRAQPCATCGLTDMAMRLVTDENGAWIVNVHNG